eukprot:1973220-Lingulodinium_polyedra.AAC.1
MHHMQTIFRASGSLRAWARLLKQPSFQHNSSVAGDISQTKADGKAGWRWRVGGWAVGVQSPWHVEAV